jgi:hypothetical protein
MGWVLRVRPHVPRGPAWALRGEATHPSWTAFLDTAA